MGILILVKQNIEILEVIVSEPELTIITLQLENEVQIGGLYL